MLARSLFYKTKWQNNGQSDRKRRQRGFKSANKVFLKLYNGSSSEPVPTHATEYIRPIVYEEHLFTESLIEPEALATDSVSEKPNATSSNRQRPTFYQSVWPDSYSQMQVS